MHEIDLSSFNIRTDLIIEDLKQEHVVNKVGDITISKTQANGNYYTLSFLDITDKDNRLKVLVQFEKVLKEIIKINNIGDDDSCLVIGLGNRLSTPDSLGVKSASKVLVSAHLFKYSNVLDGVRKVYVFNPGVMASTGIESARIIKSIIKEIKPGFVIAIDALASMSVDRINKTIQITDTGIHPGSGVSNNREEISKRGMGIPVIAIGVPTVTTSSVIVMDTINYLYKHISYIKKNEDISKLSYFKSNYKNKIKEFDLSDEDKSKVFGLFGDLTSDEQRRLINEVLNNTEMNLIVTPTEIDFLIDKLSEVIANGINNSLHRQINHL